MVRGRLFAAVVAAVFSVGAGHAAAAVITVNTTSDDTNNGDGLCSLRKAIADVDAPGSNNGDCAPAAFGANTIKLGPRRYVLSARPLDASSSLRIPSTVTDLAIVGSGEAATTIDAQSANARALEIAAGANVKLTDLTLTGGHAPDGAIGTASLNASPGGEGGTGANGGAVLNAGTLTLSDVAITGSAAGDGGAGGNGSSSTSSSGTAGGPGGAGGEGGAIYNTGSLRLTGTTISGDRAGDGGSGGGGGIGGVGNGGTGGTGGAGGAAGALANAGGALTITASTINGDAAGHGGTGGVGGQGSVNAGSGGTGGDGAAGGGLSSDGGSLAVTNSTFASDAAGGGGAGGIGGLGGTAADGGNGGSGGHGGAIAVSDPATSSLLSVTVAGNDAGDPGAPGTGAASGIAGAAGVVGGVFDQGSHTTVENSLLFENGGGNCSGSIVDSGHNLSAGGSGCPATFADGDPNLGPLQANGGPTKTISLQPGSAAIDRIPVSGAGCPAADQRGVTRPGGQACDIGAYEVVAPRATTGSANGVARRGATLNATVTANSGHATVSFDYGPTKRYGAKSGVKTVAGVTPMGVSVKLADLKANSTYHYRVTVTSSDGTSTGVDRTFSTASHPQLSSLKITPSHFRATGRHHAAATVTYQDTDAGQTTFTVMMLRHGVVRGGRCVAAPSAHSGPGQHGCVRSVKVGSFAHHDRAGRNELRFNGRVNGRALSPAGYRLQARPRAGQPSAAEVSARFTITR